MENVLTIAQTNEQKAVRQGKERKLRLDLRFFAATQHYEPLGEVRMSVRPSLLAYLPFSQKIFRQPIPQNL